MSKRAPEFHVKHWLPVFLIAILAGCSYGPDRYRVYFESAIYEPGTQRFAVAVDWAIIREPEGFVATFPNGGTPRVIEQEARLYLVDVHTQSIEMIAQLKDYGGVPVPKSIFLHPWHTDGVYLTIRGYGGSTRHAGDDTDDPRVAHLRVSNSGIVSAVKAPPETLPHLSDSANKRPPQYLIQNLNSALMIKFNSVPALPQRVEFLRIDETTGEPYLTREAPDWMNAQTQ